MDDHLGKITLGTAPGERPSPALSTMQVERATGSPMFGKVKRQTEKPDKHPAFLTRVAKSIYILETVPQRIFAET